MSVSLTSSRPCLLIVIMVMMGGCAKSFIEEEWQCPLAQGEGCLTIEEADTIAEASPVSGSPLTALPPSDVVEVGRVTETQADVSEQPKCRTSSCRTPFPPAGVAGGGSQSPAPLVAAKLREAEKLARIWIAPFVDANNILHEGGFIHVIVRPARWIGQSQPAEQ